MTTGPRVKGIVQAQFAPMTAVQHMTQRGFCHLEIPADVLQRPYQAALTKLYDGTPMHHPCHYSEAFRGLLLYADPALQAMDLSTCTVSSGKWAQDSDPRCNIAFLTAYDASYNGIAPTVARIIGPDLGADPNFVFTLHRVAPPQFPVMEPPQTQHWTLELAGGAIRIVWSRFDNPTVSAVNSDGTTTLLGTYILKDTEQQRFAMDDYQRWEIANFGGGTQDDDPSMTTGNWLYLRCGSLDGPWIVKGVEQIPSGPWIFTSYGGKCAINLTEIRYPVDAGESGPVGCYETMPISLFDTFTLLDYDRFTFRTFPSPIGDSTHGVWVEVDSTGVDAYGSTATFKVWLRPYADGSYPVVQCIECCAPPSYTDPSGAWEDFSLYLSGGGEEMAEDVTTRTARLDIDLWLRHGRQSEQFDDRHQFPAGAFLVKLTTGYKLAGQPPVLHDRMLGIVRHRSRVVKRKMTLTLADRWVSLQKQLRRAPLLHGMTVNAAVALIAGWCGIGPDDIVSTESTPPVTIPNPPDGYDKPAWRMDDGQTGASLIDKLKDAFGVKAEFWPDGKLHIYRDYPAWGTTYAPYPLSVSGESYSTAPGTEDMWALGDDHYNSGIELVDDLTSGFNAVFAEGETSEGRPIYAELIDVPAVDYDAAHQTHRYCGELVEEYLPNSNLRTETDVAAACHNKFYQRPAVSKIICQNKAAYGMVHQWPGNALEIVDDNALHHDPVYHGAVIGRLLRLTVTYRKTGHRNTVELDAAPLDNGIPTPPPGPPTPPAWKWFTIDDGTGNVGSTIGGNDRIKPNGV